ncbi:unnamed protein product [Bursaphelenchus okinawaensis]|uniref:Reverse transcriptase domain-containing protein n=1 Tax=Bursaphelenchus okinawaensis TaxID=465554 RepID=A0A811KCI7_9BILA|nr:unnamed protein product [Bursaphelenchus okinawaensis]CAG9101685.1 unnamed protein product [Bursaphelenchus okinawaensis]
MSTATLLPNYGRVIGRLRSTIRKLNHDPELLQKYDAIFKEQLTLEIIEEAPKIPGGPIHLIPHQAVVTPQKTTTKVRIVFDASCPTSNGKSLNDHLFRGPVMLPDLLGMLLRFRATPIPLLADVEKAFLQLTLDKRDRDVTRFLWLKDLSKPPEPDNIITYRFRRVCFGVVSSPFLLAACIDHHLLNYPHPLAKNMRRNPYVDNILIENDTPQDAIEAYSTSKSIFQEAKMNLREYQTNDSTVNEFLRTKGEITPEKTKVLGVTWIPAADTITLPS